MHIPEGLKRASVSMLYKETNGWEKLYSMEGTEITNTITPLYNNGLPIPPTCLFNYSLHDPLWLYQETWSLVLLLSSLSFCANPHTFISLSSSTVQGLISAIFLVIFLLPCPFSFPYIHRDKNPSPKWTTVSPFPCIIVWTVFLQKFMLNLKPQHFRMWLYLEKCL